MSVWQISRSRRWTNNAWSWSITQSLHLFTFVMHCHFVSLGLLFWIEGKYLHNEVIILHSFQDTFLPITVLPGVTSKHPPSLLFVSLLWWWEKTKMKNIPLSMWCVTVHSTSEASTNWSCCVTHLPDDVLKKNRFPWIQYKREESRKKRVVHRVGKVGSRSICLRLHMWLSSHQLLFT
jgi:hypothetical protein